jgi:hypothetical protein
MLRMGFKGGPTALVVGALLLGAAFAASGCGGGGSDTTGEAETVATTAENGGGGGQGGSGEAQGGEGGSKQEPGGNGAGGGESGSGTATNVNREPTQKEVEAFRAPPGGDNSIQTFGDVVEGDEEEEIVSTMRAFFRAIANLDYPAICDGLTAANREAFQQYLKLKKEKGSCETVLEKLLQPGVKSEALKAASGVVFQVRVEDGNAFVLFTPEDGRASYFVMKQEEDGSWKATGLSTGTPFDPTAPPTG